MINKYRNFSNRFLVGGGGEQPDFPDPKDDKGNKEKGEGNEEQS